MGGGRRTDDRRLARQQKPSPQWANAVHHPSQPHHLRRVGKRWKRSTDLPQRANLSSPRYQEWKADSQQIAGRSNHRAREVGFEMPKQLCELKKTLKRDLKVYIQLVRDATHVCSKCGRSANDKDLLCRPVKLKD